jgi:peptidoglycan hydrolase CwlO-like protein
MDKVSILNLPDEKDEDVQAAIEKCVAEVQNIIDQMANDQTEIDRLKAETRAMLAELKAA